MEAPGTRFSYLTAATSPRWRKLRLEDQALGLGHCALEASLNVSPVHNVPECLDVLALNVLVVQVECVLPHIQLQNGDQRNGDVALLIVELLDDEALADGVPCEDCPAGALNGQCNVGEVLTELVEGAEELVDCRCQLAGGLVATLGDRLFQKMEWLVWPPRLNARSLESLETLPYAPFSRASRAARELR